MVDIELVIKIPEDEYKIIKNYTGPMIWAEHLIKKGTPLPKGHGIIPYLMHKEMNIPISECQKAYDVAVDYLQSQGKLKG